MGALTHTRPISTEAQGRLRLLYARVGADADRIEAAARRVPKKLRDDVRHKFNRGAEKALAEIARSIPAPLLWNDGRRALWRYLALAAGGRLGVAVRVLTLDAAGLPGMSTSEFALTVTHHALARLLDRSGFAADPVQAVLQAHDALKDLDAEEATRLFALGEFLLPAAKGAFLLSSSPSNENNAPMSTAWTWVSDDQMYADQERYAAMWAQLTRPPLAKVRLDERLDLEPHQ